MSQVGYTSEAVAVLTRDPEDRSDVYGREMEHRGEDEIVGESRIAFNDACEYPDGTHLLSATMLEV
jgi:hypothetical protein